jgi:hypothetical protein
MADSATGRCLCGGVVFEIDLPTEFCGHCHCGMCRRAHGAGYVTWIAVQRAQFRMRAGEGLLRRYRSSDHGTRSFCGECGSSLFCESTRHPEVIDIVRASFDAPLDRAPEAHFYFSDRADWVFADDGLPRLGGATGIEPLDPSRR